MDSPGPSIYLALLGLLIGSAFFSASETAISSINRIRMKTRADDGDRRAAMVLRHADDYDRTLSTVLVGNNVVNLSMSSLATVLFTQLLGAGIGPTVATAVMTVLVLIFGEILPKSYAKGHAEQVAMNFIPLLGFIKTILTPVVIFFTGLQKLVSGHGKEKGEDIPTVTEDELKTFIDTVEEEGVLDAQESDIIQSVIDLDETTVQEILVPRVDMVALSMDASQEEILKLLEDCSFTRIPLYEDTIDHCVGMLHVRDVFRCLAQGRPIVLEELKRELLFVYRTKRLSDLLAEFRRTQHHIAVVADDYGGTLGLVTLEDVLEELVGEIFDETETAQPSPVQQLSDDLYRVEGDANIDDMFEAIGYKPPKDAEEGDYTSAAGWALNCLGHIPLQGETFRFDTLEGTVGEMDSQRIASLVVRKL